MSSGLFGRINTLRPNGWASASRRVTAICRNFLVASVLVAASDKLAYGAFETVDTALVLAIDVSQSVNDERFALQMLSIASAFHDTEVQGTIIAGPHGAMLVTLVQWSSRPFVSIPWTLITSPADADAFADRVAGTLRADRQFQHTCLSVALREIEGTILPVLPMPAIHTIIDVSGDGIDSCHPDRAVDAIRDKLVAGGATINGLPIPEGDQVWLLEEWYRDHVIGGPGAILVPARSYADVKRAMRQKLLLETSLNYR